MSCWLRSCSLVTWLKDFHLLFVQHSSFVVCWWWHLFVLSGLDFTFGLLNCVHYNEDFVIEIACILDRALLSKQRVFLFLLFVYFHSVSCLQHVKHGNRSTEHSLGRLYKSGSHEIISSLECFCNSFNFSAFPWKAIIAHLNYVLDL